MNSVKNELENGYAELFPLQTLKVIHSSKLLSVYVIFRYYYMSFWKRWRVASFKSWSTPYVMVIKVDKVYPMTTARAVCPTPISLVAIKADRGHLLATQPISLVASKDGKEHRYDYRRISLMATPTVYRPILLLAIKAGKGHPLTTIRSHWWLLKLTRDTLWLQADLIVSY